ncbi:tetratricopeptide repeat protein [Candidatus Peregrinibacteria bacterium]|nr:tetratricopeptide repeat protein [Candidatus Peregrinibacteria bacterium]
MSPDADTCRSLEQARILKEKCEYMQAVCLLEEMLTEDPGSAAVLEEIAENEWCLGHVRRALLAARRTLALHAESAMGHFILGLVALHKREFGRAVESLQYANRFQPDTPDILRSLGWALFHQGETMQGVVTLERALNLEDSNTHTLCDLGEVYLTLRCIPKARSLFLRALDIDPGNERAREGIAHAEQQEHASQGAVACSAIV